MMNQQRKPLFLFVTCLVMLLSCNQFTSNSSATAVLTPIRVAVSSPTPTLNIIPTQSLSTVTLPAAATPIIADEMMARQYLEDLVGQIGARLPGSAAEAQAANYIQNAFTAMGYTVQLQPFTFFTEDDEEFDSTNIIVVKQGQSSIEIVVGAHYDSVDDADGADDNASGVAVLLQVARMVKDVATPYTIRFIAFGAEENDLDGSHYFVSQMSEAEIENTLNMINLDSLIAGDINYVYGDTGTPESLRDWILQKAQAEGFVLEAKAAEDMDEFDGTPCDCADYDAFQEVGITFAYFEATNWNLGDEDGMTQVDPIFGDEGEIRHTRYDTIEYLDETFPGRIERNLNLYVTLLYRVLTEFGL
ncbi:MAG: M20/M25/M40 family metallo-hydrolase [Chloroflexi bacterium]|nr:M20/M25/M40 family metallo-hydrolase [Chloroflexota bacterium]MBP8058569.1 M20/M25/M40 family metallo-hydrolase [Chloroflexota bacterium]